MTASAMPTSDANQPLHSFQESEIFVTLDLLPRDEVSDLFTPLAQKSAHVLRAWMPLILARQRARGEFASKEAVDR